MRELNKGAAEKDGNKEEEEAERRGELKVCFSVFLALYLSICLIRGHFVVCSLFFFFIRQNLN